MFLRPSLCRQRSILNAISTKAILLRLSSNMAKTAFKFAGIQLAVTSDKEANLRNARSKIEEAAKNGANVICLPECFNAPYGNQYFASYAEPLSGATITMLKDAAKQLKVYIIGGSIPEVDPSSKKLFNTSVSLNPQGDVIGIHRKIHLFDIDIPGKIRFIESETLSPGTSPTIIETEYGKFGIGICYDMRFAELAQLYTRQGCVFICYPGAFNMTTGPLHFELLQRARAVDNQLFVAAVSPARDMSATYNAWGYSSVVDPWGRVMVAADEKPAIIYADIDLKKEDEFRSQIPTSKQKRTDIYTLVEAAKH